MLRLHEFVFQRAETIEQLDEADDAVATIEAAVEGQLRRGPFLFRKVGHDPMMRELVIPFRQTGYVALFNINGDLTVDVGDSSSARRRLSLIYQVDHAAAYKAQPSLVRDDD